jgi:DNA-directed RNA polymerase I, II, and III subunit RPABC1
MANTNTEPFISRLYLSRNIVLDLLQRQGFEISEYSDFSIHELNTMYTNDQLDILLKKRDELNSTEKVYVKYHITKPIRANNVDDYVEDIFETEKILDKTTDQLIIIIKDNVNDTLIGKMRSIYDKSGYYVNIFQIKTLMFNPLDHVLVPPHRIVSADEKAKVAQTYNVMNDKQYPEISRFDPIAMAIGMRPGQLCEITRGSKTAIVAYYYRLCY